MRSVLLTLVALVIGGSSAAAEAISDPTTYPLSSCMVSGDILVEGEIVTRTYDQREVRFCCKMCIKDFEKDQAAFMKKIDAAIVAAQTPDYPLSACIISGKTLDGDALEPVDHLIQNRLVRLCSQTCVEKVDADPMSALATLDMAVVAAQAEAYPATTCAISGEALGSMGDPYDYVFGGQLVRFCCSECVDTFNKNPSAALAAIYGGASEGAEDDHDHGGHDHDAHDHDDHDH